MIDFSSSEKPSRWLIGLSEHGEILTADTSSSPSVLFVGTKGSGKTEGMITALSLLSKDNPEIQVYDRREDSPWGRIGSLTGDVNHFAGSLSAILSAHLAGDSRSSVRVLVIEDAETLSAEALSLVGSLAALPPEAGILILCSTSSREAVGNDFVSKFSTTLELDLPEKSQSTGEGELRRFHAFMGPERRRVRLFAP